MITTGLMSEMFGCEDAAGSRKMSALSGISRIGLSGFAALLALAGSAVAADGTPPCVECVEVRLDHPVVVRGPSPHEPDAPVSILKLPGGTFRGFIAGGTTFAADGATPLAMGGPLRTVLQPGPPGSSSDCGRWITTVMQGLGVLYGLVHEETRCNDPQGSYKSMSIAQSSNNGLTWTMLGPIISGDDKNVPHAGGEGDCTGIDGHNGYWYAYCLHRDGKNVVARAPIENPGPGQWMKWSGNGWHAPGIGGTAVPLNGPVGQSSAYWTDADVVILLAANASLHLSISEDRVHFATVTEPIILYDADDWNRPAPTELYAYPSMVAAQGLNNIARHFYLTYTYVPPGADFSQRYLIMQEAWIGAARIPQQPQVRTALSRWKNSDGGTWTTTGPPISPDHTYAYDTGFGYLMTAASQKDAVIKLDECFSSPAGTGFLAPAGSCAARGSERRRPGGYAYRFEQINTIALFDCVSSNNAFFTSKRADCENKGRLESSLGFALQ